MLLNKRCEWLSVFVVIALVAITLPSLAASSNSQLSYIENGKPVKPWHITVGNVLKQNIKMESGEARTLNGNTIVTETSDGTLHGKWRGKSVKTPWGTDAESMMTLTGRKLDLSSIVEQAAIAVKIKIKRAPNQNTTVSMLCNWGMDKCEGKFPVKHILKKFPKNQWSNLTIPLNCFANNGKFDYSQITNVLKISTKGKLELEVESVGLVGLPAGNTGCKK
ncbi:putative glycoside hydrolase [Neiella marina]|nr:putative glycoside hydrolase [Neiella marina]